MTYPQGNFVNFIPLRIGMVSPHDLIQLKTLYDFKGDEETSLLLNVEKGMKEKEFVQQIFARQKTWNAENKSVYLMQDGAGIVKGIASVIPVRKDAYTGIAEYAFEPLLCASGDSKRLCSMFDQNQRLRLIPEFSDNSSERMRFFVPSAGEKLTSAIKLSEKQYENLRTSYMETLLKTMPSGICLRQSHFGVKKLTPTATNATWLSEFVERNNQSVNAFWKELADSCANPQETGLFLKAKSQKGNKNPSVFYGLFKDESFIGVFECSPRDTTIHLNMLVDKAMTGKGYASEALRLLERELFKRGAEEIRIECSGYNRETPIIATNNVYRRATAEQPHFSDQFYHLDAESPEAKTYFKTFSDYAVGKFGKESFLPQEEGKKTELSSCARQMLEEKSKSRS